MIVDPKVTAALEAIDNFAIALDKALARGDFSVIVHQTATAVHAAIAAAVTPQPDDAGGAV
jgi:hypothetical protein